MTASWNSLFERHEELEGLLRFLPLSTVSLPEWLARKMKELGTTKGQVVKDSQLNQTFAYQILAGTRHASREKLIQLAFGMHLNADDACTLLERGGANRLDQFDRRDVVIAFCLQKGLSLAQCDDSLWDLDLPTILPGANDRGGTVR